MDLALLPDMSGAVKSQYLNPQSNAPGKDISSEQPNPGDPSKPKQRRAVPSFIGPPRTIAAGDNIDVENADTIEKPRASPDDEQPGYIGSKSLPVNWLFYDETPFGQEVRHLGISLHNIEKECLKSGSWTDGKELGKLNVEDDVQPVFSFINPSQLLKTGKTFYVNSRIKHFLLMASPGRFVRVNRKAAEPSSFGVKGYCYGIKPYPQRLLKFSKQSTSPSMTIYLKGKAQRARLRDWEELNSDAAEAEDMYDELEARWGNANADEPDLPPYGESGSEGNMYSDSDSSEEETPTAPGMSRVILSEDAARIIVDEEISLFLGAWRTKRLPRLEDKAWSTWHSSKSSHRDDVRICQAIVNRLDDRLERLVNDLVRNKYESEDDLRKQCASLHATLGERASTLWKIGLMKQKFSPSRPTKPRQMSLPKRSKPRPVDLASDEEELSSDEDYFVVEDHADFIDNDGDIQDAMVLDNLEGNDHEIDVSGLHQGDGENVDDMLTSPKASALEDVPAEGPGVAISNEPLAEDSGSLPGHMDIGESASAVSRNLSIEDKASTQGHDNAHDEGDEDSDDSLIGAPHISSDSLTKGRSPAPENSPLTSDNTERCSIQDDSRSLSVAMSDTAKKPNLVDSLTQRRQPGDPAASSPEPSEFDINTSETSHSSDIEFQSDHFNAADSGRSDLSMNNIPNATDFDKLRKIDERWIKFFCDNKLSSHVLGYMISVGPAGRWRIVDEVMADRQSWERMPAVWDALRSIRGNSNPALQNPSPTTAEGLMQLAIWFIEWFCCFVPDDPKLFPKSKVKKTIESGIESFDEFWQEVQKMVLVCKEDEYHSAKSVTRPAPKLSSFKKKGEEAKAAQPQLQPMKKKKFGKFKKKFQSESQEAADVRKLAADRKRRADERARVIQRRHMVQGLNKDAKVYINQGKEADEDFIEVHPLIASRIKPHQVEGINFLWREVVGAREGVLLAHVMGLGKTMQCITLLVTIAEASTSKNENVRKQIPKTLLGSKTLVVCPPSLVENWHDELLKWVPQPYANYIGDIRMIHTDLKTMSARVFEIEEWVENGGVLLISYSLLVPLVTNKKTKSTETGRLTDEKREYVRKALLEHPNLVIADEAQYFKNPASELSKVMRQFTTKARIALTGSPLANNLAEYFHILDWSCKGYLGEYGEFKAEFEEPISRGLYADASRHEQRQALKRLNVLEEELEPKVHRANYNVLKGQMKGKSEFVLCVPPTNLQKQCYNLFIDSIRGGLAEAKQMNIMAWIGMLKLLCNHPSCFLDKLKDEGGPIKDKLESDEQTGTETGRPNTDTIDDEVEEVSKRSIRHMGLSKHMLEQQLTILQQTDPKQLRQPRYSRKMELLEAILGLSKGAREKTLIFSHSLPTLDFVEKVILRKYTFARLDGSTPTTKRQEMARDFNEGTTDVMLISTRAGGAGLNLFGKILVSWVLHSLTILGASRVVIMDDGFNPMNEQQAIGRAYRIGQQRHVYVYRLLIAGSFEEVLQNQAVFKLQLATRVVDKRDTVRMATKGFGQYLEQLKERYQTDLSPLAGKDKLVLDKILRHYSDSPIISSILEAESFFMEEKEQLTPEEEAEANEQKALLKLRRTDKEAYYRKIQEKQRYGFQNPQPATVAASLLGQNFDASLNIPIPSISDLGQSLSGIGAKMQSLFQRNPAQTLHTPPTAQPETIPQASHPIHGHQTGEVGSDRDPQPQFLPLVEAPSILSSSSARTNAQLSDLSDDSRKRHRIELEECLHHEIAKSEPDFRSDAPVLVGATAMGVERQIYKQSESFAAYDKAIARVLGRFRDGRWRDFVDKTREMLQYNPGRNQQAEAKQDGQHNRLVTSGSVTNQVELTTGSEQAKEKLPMLHTDNRHKEFNVPKDKLALEGGTNQDASHGQYQADTHESSTNPRNKRQKAYVDHFSLDPVSVERTPHENAGLDASIDITTETSPGVRIKSENSSNHQSRLRNSPAVATKSFRSPPGFRQSQGERQSIQTISLLTSEDEESASVPIRSGAPSAVSVEELQRNPRKRPADPSDGETMRSPGPGSRGEQPASKRARGNTDSARKEGPQSSNTIRSEKESTDDTDDLNVSQPSTASRARHQSSAYSRFPALNEALESGTNWSFSKVGK